LTKSDAQKFVNDNVNTLLFSYAKTFFIVFGIANFLASAGMWYSVHQTAIATAQAEATQYADRQLKSSIDSLQKNISDLYKDYAGLSQQYGALSEKKTTLERSVSTLGTDLDFLKNPDNAKLLNVATALNSLNDKDLAARIGSLVTTNNDLRQRLNECQTSLQKSVSDLTAELARKVSLGSSYRLKSTASPFQGWLIGDWNGKAFQPGSVRVNKPETFDPKEQDHLATTWIIEQPPAQ
jgi:hypothetical protein